MSLTNFPHPETGKPMAKESLTLYDGNRSLEFEQFIIEFSRRIRDGEFQTRARWLSAFRMLQERVKVMREGDAIIEKIFRKNRWGPRLSAPLPEGLAPEVLEIINNRKGEEP